MGRRSSTVFSSVVRELVHVANAVAVERNGVSLERLARGPNVAAVAPSGLYRPTMTASVGLIGAPDVWGDLGGRAGAGAGIKVGVVDSGIDATHDFFGCKGDSPQRRTRAGSPSTPTTSSGPTTAPTWAAPSAAAS